MFIFIFKLIKNITVANNSMTCLKSKQNLFCKTPLQLVYQVATCVPFRNSMVFANETVRYKFQYLSVVNVSSK